MQFGVFDGPVTDEQSGGGAITSYPHDDVIVCEHCVARGNDALPHRVSAVEQAFADRDEARRALGEANAYAAKLEAALAHRPETLDPPAVAVAKPGAVEPTPEPEPASKPTPRSRAKTAARSSSKKKEQ